MNPIEPAKCRGKFKDSLLEDNNGWLAEFKFHGCRYLMYNGQKILSRHISVKGGYVDKSASLPHLLMPNLKGTVLDGEIIQSLYSTVREVTSILGSSVPLALEKQRERGELNYMVFDILYHKGKSLLSLPLSERKEILFNLTLKNPCIKVIPGTTVAKRALYDSIIRNGGEGIVLKDISSKYGERSKWVKLKVSDTWDVVVMGYLDPSAESVKVDGTTSVTRYHKLGWIGSIRIGQYKGGRLQEYGSVSGMDEVLRARISKSRSKYLGMVIEIEAQSRLSSGKFEHPRFIRIRTDKRAEDCEYDD